MQRPIHDERNSEAQPTEDYGPPAKAVPLNWKQAIFVAFLGGAVSALATGAAGYITFNGRLQSVEFRTVAHESERSKLEEVRIAVARIEAKLDAQDRRYAGGQ